MRSAAADRGALRIRLGVSLVVISWLPIAQVLIWVTSADSAQSGRVRLVVWAIQIPLGFAGVAMVSESFSSFIFRATSAGIGVLSN